MLFRSGAEFELRESRISGKTVAKGESGAGGVIQWEMEDTGKEISSLTGDYTIVETKAPVGFALGSSSSWEIKFVNGIPCVDKEQTNISASDPKEQRIVIYIGNTPLYALPDSGGSGIYWYMFSGILLMAGAALITYKKRCREVLKG